MKQVLLAIAVCLASIGAACAKEYRCDANGGVYYTSDRVIDLPQDQNRWYVTVIGDPANTQFQQVTEWFETHPELRKLTQATHFSVMSTRSATPYGWRHLACAACLHLPPIRWTLRPEIRDETKASKFPPFCSEACSGSDRVGGGHDPCPWAADRITEPRDLAESDFYEYAGTLICDADAEKFHVPPPSDPDYLAWLEEHSECLSPCLT